MKKIVKNFVVVAALLPAASPETWRIDVSNTANDIINTIVTNATHLALDLAGGIAVLMIIYGGFTYLTAYGNEARATTAKNIMLWAIIGLVVIILSSVFYNEIMKLLA